MIYQSTNLRKQKADARKRHLATLAKLGWEQEGKNYWRNPRGLRIIYPTIAAIALEQLRGGIQERGKAWRIA